MKANKISISIIGILLLVTGVLLYQNHELNTKPLRKDETPPVEVPEPFAHYYGSCSLSGARENGVSDRGLLIYDIYVYDNKIHLQFYSYTSVEPFLVQDIMYQLPDKQKMLPKTIYQGLLMIDINHDRNDDFVFDCGLFGNSKKGVCFIFDESTGQYEELEGYFDLSNSYVHIETGIIDATIPAPATNIPVQYQVVGNQLVQIEE